ncbi:Zinc finger protein sdc-3 [Frankliniella fusca]|uniref:Zinc finger protein sdc-3 n=1 Tax=Frankliniella fusca TaxID=407009 RepID=A0AAE1LSH3_9NEOP|nr:Zinc finger protein sdc-3 [Frankliniella fusca]
MNYIHDRCKLFPNVRLRPKHHFMEHTKLLILKFGPPSCTSTLKFESKHKYFRSEFAAKKNNINPTQSMAVAHQFMQSALLIDKLYENGVVMTDCMPFDEITDVELVEFIVSMLGRQFASKLRFSHKVKYRNVDYEMNQLLVCSTKRHPLIELCKTILYASFGDVAYAIGGKCTGNLVTDMQFYELEVSQNLSLVNLNDLLDLTPYDTYNWEHNEVVERRDEEEEDNADLDLDSRGQDLVVDELMPFCDVQAVTKETLQSVLKKMWFEYILRL